MDLRIGLIGGGYIAKSHAFACHALPAIYGDSARPLPAALADIDALSAARGARNLGFTWSTGDWRELVRSPEIDAVAIATPNYLHREMAIAALEAGKHIFLEKPVGLSLQEAREIEAVASRRPGLGQMLGYSYLCNPMVQLAKTIIQSGEIGEILHFRGRHNEDYLADPATPHSWRCSRELAGPGALGDLGSHIISIALDLIGEIETLVGDLATVIPSRPGNDGEMRAVDNDDQAHCLLRFKGGVMGALETSRVAHGQKLGLAFEIVGSKGSIEFNQERMNELRLYEAGAAPARRGFKTLLVNTDCPDFAAFCPAPGHGLGYNDLKVIEINRFLRAITAGEPVPVDLGQAVVIEQIIEAWILSAREKSWVDPARL